MSQTIVPETRAASGASSICAEDAELTFALSRVMEVTCRLATEADLACLLKLITYEACRAVGCERATLYLYDEVSRELHAQVVTNVPEPDFHAPLGSGVPGWVAQYRQLVNISEPAQDPRWSPELDRRSHFQTRNVVAAPLIAAHDGKLLGVLELQNRLSNSFGVVHEQLVQAFSAQAAVALERAELLVQRQTANDLQASLEAARRVLAMFLPGTLPSLPGYEFAIWYQPMEEVGGDYYDMVLLQDGNLSIAMADVTGHGLGPSLIMASARAMLHALVRTTSSPGQTLSLLAETIYPDLSTGQFITFILGALDFTRHEFRFVNAGQGPCYHVRIADHRLDQLASTGFPIGIQPQTYADPSEALHLAPGDLLVLTTDGLIESRNPRGELFGARRLEELLLAQAAQPVDQVLSVLREAVRTFQVGPLPPDDISVLVIRRLPCAQDPPVSAGPGGTP